ncbi:hypothetical protein [Virgibacillus sp. DJP39]|uniref:hypothetical protein n=1 Tax=Virgibacillus sp. DJP39 TaxID=3409790 RepID=UPI003BB6B5AC
MKKYSWISYLSLGIPLVLICSLLVMPNLSFNQQPLITTIVVALYVGAPLTFVLSLIALFRKSEKNMLAIIGLILAVILLAVIGILAIFVTDYTP